MLGSIFARGKCSKCGLSFIESEKRELFHCPVHPGETSLEIVVSLPIPPEQRKGDKKEKQSRFTNRYLAAKQYLNHYRYENKDNDVDFRMYDGNDLMISSMVDEYLEDLKENHFEGFDDLVPKLQKRRKKAWKNHVHIMNHFTSVFGRRNIKSLRVKELHKYIKKLTKENGDTMAPKTKWNYATKINAFFRKMEEDEKPNVVIYPTITKKPLKEVPMKMRKTITLDVRREALEIIKKEYTSGEFYSPKIYIAFELLCNEPELRIDDCLALMEGDIDIFRNVYIIRTPTKQKDAGQTDLEYPIPDFLLPDIIKQKETYLAHPSTLFFRHPGIDKYNRVKPDTPFGEGLLNDVVQRTLKKMGVEPTDAYAFVRHSSITAIAAEYNDLAATEASGHRTSFCTERYIERAVKSKSRGRTMDRLKKLNGNVINLEEKRSNENI